MSLSSIIAGSNGLIDCIVCSMVSMVLAVFISKVTRELFSVRREGVVTPDVDFDVSAGLCTKDEDRIGTGVITVCPAGSTIDDEIEMVEYVCPGAGVDADALANGD
jgi:hypothetical protein